MRFRRSDDERRPADIARAVALGVLDPLAPPLSAVRPHKTAVVHYRPKHGLPIGQALCGVRCGGWPVARRSRTGLDYYVCNMCRARASRLRSFVRWAGIEWPVFPAGVKRAASW